MRKHIKRIVIILIALCLVMHFFRLSPYSAFVSAKTLAVDSIDLLVPGFKGKFDNIDSQMTSAIAKNSTINAINEKKQAAQKQVNNVLYKTRVKIKRFCQQHDITYITVIDFLIKHCRSKNAPVILDNSTSINAGNESSSFLPYGSYNEYLADLKITSLEEVSEMRQSFIDYSMTLRGVPYVLGGENPKIGLDCSSFVQYSAKQGINVKLPRTAREQYLYSERIAMSELEPGDLIFFRNFGRISHVGIYLGKIEIPGTSKENIIFINSASEGYQTGVVISSLAAPYWKQHFDSFGKFIPSSKDAAEFLAIQ